MQYKLADCAICRSGEHVQFISEIDPSGMQVECQWCQIMGPSCDIGEFDGEIDHYHCDDEDDLPSRVEAARLWNEMQGWIERGRLEQMRDPYQDIRQPGSSGKSSGRL